MPGHLYRLPSRIKKLLLVGLDLFLIPFSLWAAISLRVGAPFVPGMAVLDEFVVLTALTIPFFVRLGLYRAVLRYAGYHAMRQIALATLISGVVLLGLLFMDAEHAIPRSVAIIYPMMLLFSVGGTRLAARWVFERTRPGRKDRIRAVIYGAGAGGRQLLALLRNGHAYRPVAFLDDAPALRGRIVDGLEVLDPRSSPVGEQLKRLGTEEILLAIPSASPGRRREVLEMLEKFPVHVRSVPGLQDILAGRVQIDDLQEIRIEDLLGRDPVPPLPDLLHRCITGKTVLVTGAGGSIGSELCRQIVELEPRLLVILDHAEFNLYSVDLELRGRIGQSGSQIRLESVLGSVVDVERIQELFRRFQFDTVYHAAAYKHVPIVETNPVEGLRTNVFGTLNVARAAVDAKCRHFVLVSTDKAVRPTNVMGASKRLAELALQALASEADATRLCIVRFGNVLDSSGSVVPLFREQIRQGGPITLTHPEVTRYFMTIPESVQLVLQAGAMALGGDVFVLDMGQPVRIRDLATRMVHLSGRRVRDDHEPNGDIEIQVTGLRPGEKLYEELLIGDNATGTEHPRILRAEEEYLTSSRFERALEELQIAMASGSERTIRRTLTKWVKGYRPDQSIRPVEIPSEVTRARALQANTRA